MRLNAIASMIMTDLNIGYLDKRYGRCQLENVNYIKIGRKYFIITLFRKIRLYQLKTKWKLVFWQYVDKQAMELIKNPEELEKKFVEHLAKLIHETNSKPKT